MRLIPAFTTFIMLLVFWNQSFAQDRHGSGGGTSGPNSKQEKTEVLLSKLFINLKENWRTCVSRDADLPHDLTDVFVQLDFIVNFKNTKPIMIPPFLCEECSQKFIPQIACFYKDKEFKYTMAQLVKLKEQFDITNPKQHTKIRGTDLINLFEENKD
jgi:hypothetical protein